MINLDLLINEKIPLLWDLNLTNIMIFITNIGSDISLFVLSLLLFISLIYRRELHKVLLLIISMVVGLLIKLTLKEIVQRERPLNSLIHETGFSFPSGHTMMVTIFFCLFIYCYKDEIKNKALKKLFILFCALIIILIGFSRTYLNVHWFSDVIGGFVLGLVWFFLSIFLLNLIRKKITF